MPTRWIRHLSSRDRAAELDALARTVPCAVWLHDLEGRLILSNGHWHEITGQPSDETAGRGWTQVVHPEDVERVLADWDILESAPANAEMRHTLRILHAVTGEERVISEHARVVADRSGRRVGIVGVTSDITDQALVEDARRAHASEMAALTQTLPVVVWRYEADGGVTFCSDRWEAITGQPAAAALGDGWKAVLHPDDLARTMEAWHEHFGRGGDWANEYRAVRPDGRVRWLHDVGMPIVNERGETTHYMGTTVDVTDRRLVEERVLLRAEQQASVAALGRLALDAETTLHTLLDAAVHAVAEQLRLSSCGVAAVSPNGALRVVAGVGTLAPGDDPARTLTAEPLAIAALERGEVVVGDGDQPGIAAAIRLPAARYGVLLGRAEEGRTFSREDVDFLTAVANTLGSAVERARIEDTIRHQAMHDALTGLPNRTLLLDRLAEAIRRGEPRGEDVAVFFLDLDNFKVVNDSLGHDAGDELLAAVATRLRGSTRPQDTVARLGGDEFVVVSEGLAEPTAAVAVADRVIASFREPFTIRGHELYISSSVGIATGRGGQIDATALLRNADAAMYRAKEHGRNRHELFDTALRARVLARFQTEAALRGAIERRELELHYQPVVSLIDGTLDGFEALIRWRQADGTLVQPASFIPIAEESGLILAIGEWVLNAACGQAVAWNALDPDARPLRVSVNVSARQLSDEAFPGIVAAALAEWSIEPSQLGLEITETALLRDTPAAERTLTALRSSGVRILLDDFGTGYSSLAYIKRFPLTAVKLDRSFVADVATDRSAAEIVRAITTMARALDLDVVAEGVEHADQVLPLHGMACQYAQGYLFARPLVVAAATALVLEGRPWPVYR